MFFMRNSMKSEDNLRANAFESQYRENAPSLRCTEIKCVYPVKRKWHAAKGEKIEKFIRLMISSIWFMLLHGCFQAA
jgi:hypothetical protein